MGALQQQQDAVAGGKAATGVAAAAAEVDKQRYAGGVAGAGSEGEQGKGSSGVVGAMAAASQQIQRRSCMDGGGGGAGGGGAAAGAGAGAGGGVAGVGAGGGGGGGGKAIPPDFRCPLSLELMSDPVIVSSGQTYERAYIQQWLDQGNTTCPKTRQGLTHTNLIPNYTVKALIASWCEANNVPLPEPARLQSISLNRPLSPVVSAKAEAEERISALPLAEEEDEEEEEEEEEEGREQFPAFAQEEAEAGQDLQRGDSHCSEDGASACNLDAERTAAPCMVDHSRSSSGSSDSSSQEDVQSSSAVDTVHTDSPRSVNGVFSFSGLSAALDGVAPPLQQPAASSPGFSEEPGSPARVPDRASMVWRRRGEEREHSMPRIVPAAMPDVMGGTDDATQQRVDQLVQDLQSPAVEVHRVAAAELRLLAKFNMENRISIANCGAIRPLVALLKSTDQRTQENAVTALLNLSINDINKSEIAAAGAVDPLVHVLRVGSPEARENAAATLFSLSVMDDNKVSIGASGAIPPLVHLLINGTPRGKKDAATALFNLSIYHENKSRIVRHGAVKPLVELMSEPASGMVDKAVAVLANLATIQEGKVAIGDEGGIPALVEVVEAGSPRGKENAAAALLQLCMVSHRHRAMVLQEGAIPPLHALSQTGTARAKEKASALLRHFRDQRHGRGPASDRHGLGRHY